MLSKKKKKKKGKCWMDVKVWCHVRSAYLLLYGLDCPACEGDPDVLAHRQYLRISLSPFLFYVWCKYGTIIWIRTAHKKEKEKIKKNNKFTFIYSCDDDDVSFRPGQPEKEMKEKEKKKKQHQPTRFLSDTCRKGKKNGNIGDILRDFVTIF